MLRWTLWDNHKLTGSIAPLRFHDEVPPRGEAPTRRSSPGSPSAPATALEILDRHLFASEWVAADHITTADLSCVGYLYYDHEFGHDLTAYPNIERWRQAIAALPGWKHPYDLMPGHPIPAGPCRERRPPTLDPRSANRPQSQREGRDHLDVLRAAAPMASPRVFAHDDSASRDPAKTAAPWLSRTGRSGPKVCIAQQFPVATHDRRLHLRRHPHPARQGPPRRQPCTR